jgi:hypothetical protein
LYAYWHEVLDLPSTLTPGRFVKTLLLLDGLALKRAVGWRTTLDGNSRVSPDRLNRIAVLAGCASLTDAAGASTLKVVAAFVDMIELIVAAAARGGGSVSQTDRQTDRQTGRQTLRRSAAIRRRPRGGNGMRLRKRFDVAATVWGCGVTAEAYDIRHVLFCA